MFGTDRIGTTFWAKTTNSNIGTDKWEWNRPAQELRHTRFSEKLADRLLHGGGLSNCTSYADGKCGLPPDLSAPNWGYDSCCWEAATEHDLWTLGAIHQYQVSDLTDIHNANCMDLLDPAKALGVTVHYLAAAFADGLPKDTSCEGSHVRLAACAWAKLCMHSQAAA